MARGPATDAPSRPRILRLITRMNIGGPARHALLLARGLEPEYHTILAAGRPLPSEGELSDPQVPVLRLPLVRQPSAAADAQALAAVRRLLVRRRPALLHTHMAKAGTVGRLAALSMWPRPRTVHTFHGHVLDGYFDPWARRAFIEAERMLARKTDVLVAVSAEVRDELMALGIGRPDQFHVIRLGLDLAPFLATDQARGRLRAHLGLADDTPLIGVSGRLVPIKDHTVLLAAMVDLPGAHLAVIGDGELRAVLERQALELGIAQRVHFTGWWPDMPGALADLDVVVLASRNEGTPVALIEASAAGRPVVATDVGGVRSVVIDGSTGYLATAGDSESLATSLARLLADDGARRRMGAAGREHVRQRFGQDRLLADIRDLYSDLLARASRGRGRTPR